MRMKKTTTNDNEMLQFIYGEFSASKKQDFKTKMLLNNALYEEFRELNLVKQLIDESAICPKITTLKNILAYAKA